MRILIGAFFAMCASVTQAQAPTFTATKVTGEAPLSTVLTWNVAGAATCTAGGAGTVAAWSGSVPIAGTRSLTGIGVDMRLSLTCAFAALPGSALLQWIVPTTNTDGSALTDLGGYRILYGTAAASLTRSIDLQVPGANTYRVDALAPGSWFFALTSRTLTCFQASPAVCRESAQSNTASRAVAGITPPPVTLAIDIDVFTVPAPPTNLTASDPIAYEIRKSSTGSMTAARIGLVPIGTVCIPRQQKIGAVTYSAVQPSAVDLVNWPADVKLTDLWAKCS